MSSLEIKNNNFERFLESLAREVISDDSPKLTLLLGKNGTGKSFVLGRILEKSVARNVKTLAVSFGVTDRFPFRLAGPYQYIGTRSSTNAVHVNSIDSKIFDSIVAKWHDGLFRRRLEQICELLEIPNDFTARITLRSDEDHRDLIEFFMDSWLRRAGSARTSWPRLLPGESYSDEHRHRFFVDLKKKFEISIEDLMAVTIRIRNIVQDGLVLGDRSKGWQVGSVPLDAIGELQKADRVVAALRFMGVVRDFALLIGKSMDASQLSSGQMNILFTLVQMSRYADAGSLILIDEPEISLHPDWQSRYLSFLHRIFANVPCNIVIATHSPFFTVSEETEGAATFSLRRTIDGHQWQRIETLSGVAIDVAAVDGFGVRYSSSPHLEQLLLRAVEELGKAKPDQKTVGMLYERLSPLVRDTFDPLQIIVDRLAQVGA